MGATCGIGREVAVRLAKRGPVLVVGRQREIAESLAAELGPHAKAVVCDLSDTVALAQLAQRVPRLGALVVTAALSPQASNPRMIVDTNLAGVARLVDAFAPAVSEGSVGVCLASITAHAEKPSPELPRALDNPLGSSLFNDLAAARLGLDSDSVPRIASRNSSYDGFVIAKPSNGLSTARGSSCITPGVIETPMTSLSRSQRPAFVAELESTTALRRAGRPKDVAAVVDFL